MSLVDIAVLRINYPDVPAGTFRRWASLGWITRHGYDRRGRALYDSTEVDEAIRTRRPRA